MIVGMDDFMATSEDCLERFGAEEETVGREEGGEGVSTDSSFTTWEAFFVIVVAIMVVCVWQH